MSEWINVSSTTPRVAYTATASQTAFTVPFVFFENADLSVYQNGSLLTLSTHYTVAGAESESGGTVTLLTGATVGDIVMIVRTVAIEQTTHIPPSGPLDVPALNVQISKLIAIDQQLADTQSRTLRLPDNISGTLQIAAPVASEWLKWNATADGVESAAVITPSGSFAVATQSEAEAGTLNDVLMTPLRTKQASKILSSVAVDTRTTAIATSFNAATNTVRTGGYATAGDGGDAVYARTGASTTGGFQSADGSWWKLSGLEYNVRQLGAKGDDTNDDGTIIQSAIDALAAAYGGGIVYVPPGNYYCPAGIVVKNAVYLRGAGNRVTTIDVKAVDVTAIQANSAANAWRVSDFQIFGKGAPNDTTFGATSSAVSINGAGGVFCDCIVYGGSSAIFLSGVDNIIRNIYATSSYGSSLVQTVGADWYERNKFDHLASINPTNSRPYPAWAAATVYAVGTAVSTAGYVIVCTQAGTSAGVAPTLKNYGQTITDNTVTWNLAGPVTYDALLVGVGAAENHFVMTDFSGIQSGSFNVAAGATGAILDFSGCVFSGAIGLNGGKWVSFRGCEFGSTSLFVDPSINAVSITGCFAFTAMTVAGTNTIMSGNYQIT